MAKAKPPSKNSGATAGASKKSTTLVGAGEPESNLPFSLWTAGPGAAASGTAGPNHTGFDHAVNLPTGLKRGRLREASPSLRGSTTPFRLYFMFNPATIQHVYSFDPAATPPAFETFDNLSIPNMTQGASISFTLRFDRVFEVWQGHPATISGKKGPGQVGTLWDMRALDRLLGVFADEATGRALGPAIGYPIIASFGAEGGKAIDFYGYINAVQVEHTMFDANMTPVRTDVGISMTQTYLPSAGAPTSDSTVFTGGAGTVKAI